MYKIKIVEEDCRKNDSFKHEKLSYRVSITHDSKTKEIIINREYYRVGFRDGEKWDDFYFDFELPWRNNLSVTNGSIMTRKLDDPNYLIEIEEKLIKEYYKKCIKSIENINKELIDVNKKLTNERKKYNVLLNTLDKTFRAEKLQKIINETVVK